MFLKTRSLWLIRIPALFCTGQLWADSVTLVTGEKITGTIKGETASDVTIDVPVSTSITDERVIQKQDIAKIDREQPDEIAYRQLIAIQPSSQVSYSSQTYGQILDSLEAFQKNYPNSSYLPEIKKLADAFAEEKKRVDAGEIKYMGRWLSKDEAERRRIQITALQVYMTMQQQAAAGNLIEAMQSFGILERNYSTTRSFPAAVLLAREVLTRLQQDLAVRMQQVKLDQDQLQKTIAFTAEPEKSNIIADAKVEQARDNQAVEAAVRSGAVWVPLIPRCQLSIETLQKTAASEAQRLAAIPVATMNASLEKVDAASKAMLTGDLQGADSLLKEASTLWAQNEAAHYWADRLKEKMATPTPTPARVATPKPSPSVPRATPRPVAAVTPPPPTPVPVAETPFYMTVTGGISIAAVVLIAGGLGATLYQKRVNSRQVEE